MPCEDARRDAHVGPLALVRDGDLIELDIEVRSIDMLVGAEELARRKAAWRPPQPKFTRGYGVLYLEHIQQGPQRMRFRLPGDRSGPASGGKPEIH
jgi:dihydroxyacid dehydratase/phosphogluconate dehydratase